MPAVCVLTGSAGVTGAITFTGSMIAYGKLNGDLDSGALALPASTSSMPAWVWLLSVAPAGS